MPSFKYTARKLTGQSVEGEAAADSVAVLTRQLDGEGLVLVSARNSDRRSGLGIPRTSGTVKTTNLVAFAREFRSLISAGMPIVDALEKLRVRKGAPVLSAAIGDVATHVRRGQAVDVAMARHPQVFDPLFQAAIRAGLATGQVDHALEQLVRLLTLRHKIERKTRRAMTYPIFLLGLLAVVLAILMLFVLPRFATLYQEFDADLPLLTQVLITSVATAPIWIPAVLLSGLALTMTTRLLLRHPSTRLRWDRVRLRVPAIGPVRQDTALVQISFMMSMLLSAGVVMREAMRFTGAGLNNTYLQSALYEAEASISRGRSLSDALAEQNIFPDLSHSLIEAGEAAGDLDRMFAEVAKLHEDQLDDRLSRLLALIEPGMMLLVGLVLGTVIVAVYMPIFGISSFVQ